MRGEGLAGQALPRRPEIEAAGHRSPTIILESVPEVDSRLKSPVTADRKFEEVVKAAQDAAVLVLVY